MLTIAQLIDSFPRPAQRAAAPRLLVVGGLPVSGKSTLARILLQRCPQLAHVEADAIRQALTGNNAQYTAEEHSAVHGTVIELSRLLLLEGYCVIADATNLRRRDRRLYLAAGAHREIATAVAWCAVGHEESAVRLAGRAAKLDPNDFSDADTAVWERMRDRGSLPVGEEADLVLTVTPDNVVSATDKLIRFFAGVSIPELISE